MTANASMKRPKPQNTDRRDTPFARPKRRLWEKRTMPTTNSITVEDMVTPLM